MKALIISIIALVISLIALLQSYNPDKVQEIKGLSCHRCGSSKVIAYRLVSDQKTNEEFVYVCGNCNFVVKR